MESSSFQNNKENVYLQKKIKGYTISYCNSQLYGKGIRGQLRLGFSENSQQKKLFIFRIVPLPTSNQFRQFIALQRFYSNLSKVGRTYNESVKSSSNQYIPMQYFPKTFYSQLTQFKNNCQYAYDMLRKLLQAYSWLYFMKMSHNNIGLKNIGITFDSKVKLMDFILPMSFSQIQINQLSLDFQRRSREDLQAFRQQIVNQMFKNKQNLQLSKLPQDKIEHIYFLFKEQITWPQIFKQWQIDNILSKVQSIPKQDIRVKANMMVLLHQLNDKIDQLPVNSQFLVDMKYSLMLLMYSHVIRHNRRIQIQSVKIKSKSRNKDNIQHNQSLAENANRFKQEDLKKQENKLKKVLFPMPYSLKNKSQKKRVSYYNSIIHDMIKDHKLFGLSASQRLALICGLIPQVNHPYIFEQILERFLINKQSQQKQNISLLLSQGLLNYYWETILSNMISIEQ